MRFVGTLSVLLGTIATLVAQTATNTESRTITSQEAVDQAIEHNLDVQIERYNPFIAQYTLSGAYGAYEPTLNFSGEHQYDESGAQLLNDGLRVPGSTRKVDYFSSGITGYTPWGMTYDLRGTASDTYGRSTSTNSFLGLPFEGSEGQAFIKLTQPLLKNFFTDDVRTRIRLAKNDLKVTEWQFVLRLIEVVTTTEETYYNLIASRQFVQVQEKAVELAERLLAENRKRVEVGAMAPLDEKQAEAQAASSRADLVQARNAVAISEDTLKSLITDDYLTLAKLDLVPTDPLKAERQFLDRQDSWSKGLAQRPEFQQAKLQLANAGIQLKFARNQLLPQVDLFGTYGYNGSGAEFSDMFSDVGSADRPFYSFGGAISVPLGNSSARNAYRTSKAQREQAILNAKRIEQQIMVEIDNAIKQAQSSYQRVGALRAAREFAAAALDAEQKKLESGKSTSFEVLRLQRDLTTAGGDEIRALAEYNRALARLRQFEGATLQYRGIDVEVKK